MESTDKIQNAQIGAVAVNEAFDPFAIFDVRAEDITSFEEIESGNVFYEPQPGDDGTPYISIIRFCPNIYDSKDGFPKLNYYLLPNPDGNGKFMYHSPSTVGKPCALSKAFFAYKDSADEAVAASAKTISRKRYRCAVIQIIKDTQHPELDGTFKLFKFQYEGDIDNKVKAKVAPTQKEKELKDLAEVNVADPFGGLLFAIQCEKGDRGRDFSKSEFDTNGRKKAILLPDGVDKTGKKLYREAKNTKEDMSAIVALLSDPSVSLKAHFMYADPDAETMAKVAGVIANIASGTLAGIVEKQKAERTGRDAAKNAQLAAGTPNADEAKAASTPTATVLPKGKAAAIAADDAAYAELANELNAPSGK